MSSILPDTPLFLYMYVRKEALLSSQIEGTQSSLSDLLAHEDAADPGAPLDDVREVSRYVAALEHGLRQLRTPLRTGLPLSLRLFREVHYELMQGSRGAEQHPGEFRGTQNWIGGTRPGNAHYVPPPPEAMMDCLHALESFLHETDSGLPVLIKAALAHVQFETIHPFLDGNGRMGRLLITLMLCDERVLVEPSLYLSLYLKTHRTRYYELLQSVREDGDWESWLGFFLDGVIETSEQATATAREILRVFEEDRVKLNTLGRASGSALRVHEYLQKKPLVSVPTAVSSLTLSAPTVRKSIEHLERLGIVQESSGKRRDRRYVYRRYLDILNRGTELDLNVKPHQQTKDRLEKEPEPELSRPSDHAWAKLSDASYLPLVDHGADVTAVMDALLSHGWQRRLEAILQRSLSVQDHAALTAMAFLHDLGKCNRGFWGRQFENAPVVGHTAIVLVLERMEDPWTRLDGLSRLAGRSGADLLMATLSHHGAPIVSPPDGLGQKTWWQAKRGYDPVDELAGLLKTAEERFPLAFDDEHEPVALSPRAISLYAGLLTLADWIGSDTNTFPIDGVTGDERVRRSAERARERVIELGLGDFDRTTAFTSPPTFTRSFDTESPYAIQSLCGRTDLGSLVVLEAETGSGKTEAALWRFANLCAENAVDGLYFALPTRTSAVQMHTRVQTFLDRTFGDAAPQAVLAVPGYLRAGRREGQPLGPFDTLWPDDPNESHEDATWAAETSKRFLSARVAIGTVDQAMLSGLRSRHAHLRAATLARSLLVVDEVHASDPYMTEVLARVLDNHRQAGGHAMLLSATLGAAARTRYLGGPRAPLPDVDDACETPYPALHDAAGEVHEAASDGRTKSIEHRLLPHMGDPEAVARLAFDAATEGARVLVIRNTVDDAIGTLEALEALCKPDDTRLFRVGEVATLHHGRFAPVDRRLLDEAIETAFGKQRESGWTGGIVGVGTQTLEISLDLDADLLLTDLAPMDVLLQRFGRLHRHRRDGRPADFERPQAIVLVPEERDLTPYLGRVARRHGLGPVGDGQGGVYPNLPAIEATWRELEARASLDIPGQNRALVERTTHPDVWRTIERELDWTSAGTKREGVLLNDRRLARDHSLDLGIPFSELDPFPADDEAVRTRIGASSRLVEIDPPALGPFGRRVGTVQIPGWMMRGESPDAIVRTTPFPGGFTLDVGAQHFVYDRFGLRRDAGGT